MVFLSLWFHPHRIAQPVTEHPFAKHTNPSIAFSRLSSSIRITLSVLITLSVRTPLSVRNPNFLPHFQRRTATHMERERGFAQNHFSVVTTKLASHLNLSPSMAVVTLLALGNGSALVVGFVAIYAAPFLVDPAPFVRDVLFYLTAAFFLFYVYLSAEIFPWQVVGFVAFYIFFVGFVFYMHFGLPDRGEKSFADLEGKNESYSDDKPSRSHEEHKRSSGFSEGYRWYVSNSIN